MDAVAVDLTADEVRDAGLWVVRVIIPELVPISFVHRARYLGTPRLVEQASRARGHVAGRIALNDDPLPFA
jgi:ribosomal protein S12 methylthiotransferase accessory factor